jgi:hypothetical protein
MIPVQTIRACWTSSTITYCASTRRRRRRSSASFTTAIESITTIRLAARFASSG